MDLRHVVVDVDGSRRRVCLSGAALTLTEARELELVAGEIAEATTGPRPEVRVVTIGTQGADFCPGAAADLDPLTAGVNPAAAIAGIPVPVVAALRGRVESVGLELALAADIRVAEPGVELSLPDVMAGRLPCWGGTQRLPRLAGRSVAARMVLGGEVLDADAAVGCGLVQVLGDDADAAAAEVAQRLDELAPLALAAAKEALAKGPELPMRHALELEGDLNHLLQTTADRTEGLTAFFEKRAPRFEGA
jgi:enoyl-CoA hydratase/carnithine racemase